MSSVVALRRWRFVPLALLLLSLAACLGGARNEELVRSEDIPAEFDVVLLAEKDSQFDYSGVPLTAEALRDAMRYRKEEALSLQSVLLKRGEKQKVTDAHILALMRVAHELGFRAWVEQKGETGEIRVQSRSK
ncbi:hypothetical protein [Dokdonella koreensis]|uniref:Uncharacterized protein n=1 Tax=Dokdonella koreensis DS-123 TaxID=1300342 RepID=A0A160DUZ0_9GAMM|nr:hypothetical protein [Dokdonella koreensis]ANB18325.1 Hypothetical protein I596_2315 [Dokdonella koreensis DS-123]